MVLVEFHVWHFKSPFQLFEKQFNHEKRHERAWHIDTQRCGSLSLMNFHTLCWQVLLKIVLFPKIRTSNSAWILSVILGSFPSYAAHPKQVLCGLNYGLSYACTASLVTDDVCSETCAIPLAFQCHRSLSPAAAAGDNGISLLHWRTKVAWQHFWSW